MSMNRVCPNCFQKDSLRVNFGSDIEAEIKFHSQKWCSCGYSSPTDMMLDQDMGFEDPTWFTIAKSFLESYHSAIIEGHIQSAEQLVRFFLKLLKSEADWNDKSIELVDKKRGGDFFSKLMEIESVEYGKAKRKPKTNIFKHSLFSIDMVQQKPIQQQVKQKIYYESIIVLVISVLTAFVIGVLLGAFSGL